MSNKEYVEVNRNFDHEAVQSLDQFVADGHQIGDGWVCKADCPACARWPVTPEAAYEEIMAMFSVYPNGGTRTVRRQFLHALSQHPMATWRRGPIVSVIVQVYVTKNQSTITLRSHAPIQGSKEAHTEGFKMNWTERSSEGLNPK